MIIGIFLLKLIFFSVNCFFHKEIMEPLLKKPKRIPNPDENIPPSNTCKDDGNVGDPPSVLEMCIALRCDPQQVYNVAQKWGIAFEDALEMVYNVDRLNPNTNWETLGPK